MIVSSLLHMFANLSRYPDFSLDSFEPVPLLLLVFKVLSFLAVARYCAG